MFPQNKFHKQELSSLTKKGFETKMGTNLIKKKEELTTYVKQAILVRLVNPRKDDNTESRNPEYPWNTH